jgi:hypothetical protein
MKTVEYSAKYQAKAKRKEVIIRLLWAIPSGIVAGVLCFIGVFTWGLQFAHILLHGERNKTLNDWNFRVISYMVKLKSYTCMLTDERSPLFPED